MTFVFDIFISFTAGKSRFGSLLSLSHSPGKTDRLYMKGPGGRGEVEVAVSGVVGISSLFIVFVNDHFFSEHKPITITNKPLLPPKKEKLAFITEAQEYIKKIIILMLKCFGGVHCDL